MNLDDLGRIQRLETPPFLFARIQQKIEQSKKESMPKRTGILVALSFVLLLIVNSIVLVNYNSKANNTENITQSLHLTSNNSLYK